MVRAGVPVGAWTVEAGIDRRVAAGPPTVLLRVDDYPHWSVGLERYWAFHTLMAAGGAPFLLAATPFLAANPLTPDSPPRPLIAEEWARLAAAVARGEVEVALHGITHRTRHPGPASEFDGVPAVEATQGLADAWGALEQRGCRPVAFVPPFNRLPPAIWSALPPQCRILCLGPESLRDAPALPVPTHRDGRCVVMSLPPFYGRARAILRALRRGRWLERGGAVVPITLHWTWELEDLAGVTELIEAVAPFAVRWSGAEAIRPEGKATGC